MVRGSGAIVAATVAMIEQQQLSQSNQAGLRRVGAVPVLPQHNTLAQNVQQDAHQSNSDASSTDGSETSSDDQDKSPVRVVNSLLQKNEGKRKNTSFSFVNVFISS